MEIQSIKLVYFSPTGTTKAVVQGILTGMNGYPEERINITEPEVRQKPLQVAKDELLVIAVPVYIGRVPALLSGWFKMMHAQNSPAVCIAVYGNRAYEDALVELKDIVTERGCKPVACAAFIGEHSFSSPEIPIAEGRPDVNDLHEAELFGQKIIEKLRSVSLVGEIPDIAVPGNRPYGGSTELWSVDFIAVGSDCMQCGICAEICPVGAVDPGNSALIDTDKCITCCACIKSCPQNARAMKPGQVWDVAVKVHNLYRKRKEPELFL